VYGYGFHTAATATPTAGGGGLTLHPAGLSIGLVMPVGMEGWDHTVPAEAPGTLALALGQVVVDVGNTGGGEAPPYQDPSFTALSVIEAARDRHQSFDKVRHPDPILLRFIDRHQRVLLGQAVQRNVSFFAAKHEIPFPLTSFADGYAIPFAFHSILGGDVELIDGALLSWSLVPYGQREQPSPFYAAWAYGGRLYFRGSRGDWGGVVAVHVDYVPDTARITTLRAVIQLPRAAEPALVEATAAFMAGRSHNDPQIPRIDEAAFIRRAEREEETFFTWVAAQRRTQIKQIREVW
jgi:hypothetical protein